MSQQEDDLRALAKIMDFLRAMSIVLVVINIYWFCPELHPSHPDGFFSTVNKVLSVFDRSCHLFHSQYTAKWFALLLLALSCFGTRGVKNEDITWRTIWMFLGLARNAHGGTVKKERLGWLDKANKKGLLYLEHIHKLPASLQTVLVKLIELGKYTPIDSSETKDFTAHIVTSCDDVQQLKDGTFIQKLYELLSYNVIKVPPLRESPIDIIPTSEMIIKDYFFKEHITIIPALDESAKIKLYTHCWPGNYRELKSCIESAVARSDNGLITEHDLNITETDDEKPLSTDKKSLLIFYLVRYNGKKTDVAEAMNVSRPTLNRLLLENEVDANDFKRKVNRKKL